MTRKFKFVHWWAICHGISTTMAEPSRVLDRETPPLLSLGRVTGCDPIRLIRPRLPTGIFQKNCPQCSVMNLLVKVLQLIY